VIYKCSAYYAPGSDRALQFDDPEIGIDWGVTRAGAVLSAKDAAAPALRDLDSPFTWEGAA
jgi:dTDP-4-dehydrorhamnose 3,5-epimerase